MRTTWSDSSLPLLYKCLGPVVLPRVDHINFAADAGTIIHENLEHRAKYGYQKAMAMLQDTVENYSIPQKEKDIAIARCKHFTWCPPPNSISELALAWDLSTDIPKVVRVEGGHGSYNLNNYLSGPGTIDILFSEPNQIRFENQVPTVGNDDVLWVCDYKTGKDTWVDSIEKNWQLKSAVAKAAKWTGAKNIIPAVIYIGREEGTWDVVSKIWDKDKIDQVTKEVLDLHKKIYFTNKDVTFVEGYHCRYCPVVSFCPAKVSSVNSLLKTELESTMTEEKAREIAKILPIAKDVIAKAEDALKDWVKKNEPIDVGSDRVYGPVDYYEDEIITEKAIPVLKRALRSFDVHAYRVSKNGINIAVEKQLEAMGIKGGKAASMRSILIELRKEDAIVPNKKTKWTIYRNSNKDFKDE